MFKIGDFSRLCNVSIRMLRHYDEIGLLVPDEIDDFTGYRYYGAKQLYDVNRITELKLMGFSLKAIRGILDEYNDADSLKKYLKIHYLQASEEAENAQFRLKMIDTAIKRLERSNNGMEYNVTLKKFPKQYFACMRNTLKKYEDEGVLWAKFYKALAENNIKSTDGCLVMAVYHDEGFKESDVDVEVRISVDEKYKQANGIEFKTTQETETAATIMKGDYSNTSSACESLGKWIEDNGYEISGPSFMIYMTNPSVVKDPEDYVSEVCFPVKKKK